MALFTKVARLSASVGVQAVKQLRVAPHARQWRYISFSSYLAAERRYTDKHEWVELDGQVGIIGISNYAQEALGDVVFAQLPEPGTALKQHDECGALESVKAASEVYCPVSGEVVEKNSQVEETPALVNSNCYDKGWLFKVKIADVKEFEKLMSEKDYEAFLKSESH